MMSDAIQLVLGTSMEVLQNSHFQMQNGPLIVVSACRSGVGRKQRACGDDNVASRAFVNLVTLLDSGEL